MRIPIALLFVDQRGSAVLLSLVFTLLLTMIGVGLVAVTNTERAAADNFRSGMAALYAAEALAHHAVSQLAARPQWTSALCCRDYSALADASMVHETTWREEVDLESATRELQRQSDASFGTAPNRPIWRPYPWGPVERLVAGASPAFLIAWVADDRSEVDNDPLSDGNAVILVRARAIGIRGLRRTVELVLARVEIDSSESPSSTPSEPDSDNASSGDVAQNLRDPSGDALSEVASGSRVQILSWREVQ